VKVEAFFFVGVTAFFVVIATIYAFTSYEDAGTVLLIAAALLGLFLCAYLLRESRRIAPRPEDRPDATLADGAGEVQAFPAASIWPFAFGFGATALATGVIFGIWIAVIGAALFVFGAIGYVLEARRQTD
jgi:hypothetical protein